MSGKLGITGEASSPSALQSGGSAEAKELFVAFPGQYFTSKADWVHSGQHHLTSHPDYHNTEHMGPDSGWRGHHFTAMCFDQKGRRCRIGLDFMRAEADNSYPIWWIWPDQIVPLLQQASLLSQIEEARSADDETAPSEAGA